MSLHDRDYYRDDDSGSWSEWLDTRGAATVIGITCAVFLLQLFSAPRGGDKPELLSRQELREKYPDIREKTTDGVRKYSDLYLPAVLSGEVWRVVTAFWVNDIRNLVGVIVSLLVIYFAGKMIEPIIGGKEFFVFYWYAGLFVMLGMLLGKVLEKNVFPQLLAWPFDAVFGTCGNTGPVTAILALIAFKYWDQPVRFFFGITMPAWAMIAIILGVSLLFSLSLPDRGEIIAANFLGIAAAGIYHRSGIRIVDRMPRFNRTSENNPRRLSRLKLVPPPDSEPTEHDNEERMLRRIESRPRSRDQAVAVVDEQLEAKLDRVLDKVAKTGTGSLSSDEKNILLKASEAYKRRRGE